MVCRTIGSPVGFLSVTCQDGFLTGLSFAKPSCIDLYSPEPNRSNTNSDLLLLDAVIDQLEKYFSGKLDRFSVPTLLSGTRFQRKVWFEMNEIPYGHTRTYSQIANAVNSPRAARAVGNACAANPIAIIVPCHRVVAANGMGGYGGGIAAKRWLLTLEENGLPPPWVNSLSEEPI